MLWIQSMCSESPSSIIKCSNAGLFSDLMTFTAVNETLSKQSRNVLFQRKFNWTDSKTTEWEIYTIKRMYSKGVRPCKFYGLPKFTKRTLLLGPYYPAEVQSCVAWLRNQPSSLDHWYANLSHHIRNTSEIVEQVKNIRLEEGRCIISYDVKALFPPVPVEPALTIMKNKLEQDLDLHRRTSMSIHHIITLLELNLKKKTFPFQGRYYEQVHEAAMGSIIRPIVANLFTENLQPRPSTLKLTFQDC